MPMHLRIAPHTRGTPHPLPVHPKTQCTPHPPPVHSTPSAPQHPVHLSTQCLCNPTPRTQHAVNPSTRCTPYPVHPAHPIPSAPRTRKSQHPPPVCAKGHVQVCKGEFAGA
nr:PREDICTED: pollen-specific leucine-rich repeat extensin-like protein 3 [Apteryx mantelli mantelli]